METLMFAFGVLTMVLVAIAAIAVYSTVKVLKLKKSLEMQMNALFIFSMPWSLLATQYGISIASRDPQASKLTFKVTERAEEAKNKDG